ncbi:efflux RND transporter periplasmic adaptor subunit [Modicisalibacter xianhensis]|uniref:Membrane fusion protein, multidrug efflux system n=1 Tax=Modicisalibacter xianhensis TaxID=442341 RepID=A0A1I3AZY6_9GAMM|nr:efflux RND transporter periplasmic adaptor subunit [Halomonas xianhensis]SFH55635.1 membrane fusion protein, multidrug efflux system [Halomonas xianhensis]
MRVAASRHRLCLGMALMALALAGCGEEEQAGQGQGQQPPPRTAQVTEMAPRDIPLDKSYSAMLRSDDEVRLVARVEGTLEARHFEPGEMVEKGDSLYTIEPDVYRAIVRQREADLKSAQAEANRARRDAERFERLLRQNSVSEQQRDQALAELRVAEANVAQARAALESAQIDLNYSDVTAPVSGQISLSEVNVGNFVASGTELATITPLDPLEVRFQMPQEDAFELRRQRREGQSEIIAVLEFPTISGNAVEPLEGQLDFLGAQVSESTSTVQASAHFDNPEGLFLPGQFVRVRLEGLKRYDVLAVPEIAVTQGLMGPQVFVLDEQNTARTRNVTVGESAGPWEIITDGLEPGDRVIVSDPGGLEAGTSIDPQPFGGDAERLSAQAEEEEATEQAEAQEAAGQAEAGQEASAAEDGEEGNK